MDAARREAPAPAEPLRRRLRPLGFALQKEAAQRGRVTLGSRAAQAHATSKRTEQLRSARARGAKGKAPDGPAPALAEKTGAR